MAKREITLQEAEAVIRAHREAQDAAKAAANRQYVGRYFKYLNSYSLPQPDERWWLYCAIESVDDVGTLRGWTFEHAIDDKITIERGVRANHVVQSGQEIGADEFWIAAAKIAQTVADTFARAAPAMATL
jgi:hypothetical protein